MWIPAIAESLDVLATAAQKSPREHGRSVVTEMTTHVTSIRTQGVRNWLSAVRAGREQPVNRRGVVRDSRRNQGVVSAVSVGVSGHYQQDDLAAV